MSNPIVQVLVKLAHITDLHLNPLNKIPQSRTDSYHEDTRFEFDAFRDLIADRSIDGVLCSGDYFNLKNQAAYGPTDLNYYSAMFNALGVPIWGIPGNHDLPKSSYALVGQTAYRNLVNSTAAIVDVSEAPVDVEIRGVKLRIGGIPYLPLETTIARLPALNAALDLKDGLSIALLHLDALPNSDIPLHFETCSWDDLQQALPDVNVMCLGHIHASFPIRTGTTASGQPQFISKPWSSARIVKDYYQTTDVLEHQHRPMYTEVTVGLDEAGAVRMHLEYVEIPHVGFDKAFLPQALRDAIEKEGRISSFIQSLSASYGSADAAFQIEKASDLFERMEFAPQVRDTIREYLDGTREKI